MRVLKIILRGIDWFTEWNGKTFSWLIFLLIAVIVYDVCARYLFNAPTIWAYDVAWMTGCCLLMFGLSYVHLYKGEIKVEALSRLFPPKVVAILNLFFRIFFFYPLMFVYLKTAFAAAILSYKVNETYQYGIWYPTMIPYRVILVLGFSILTLVGTSHFVFELQAVIGRKGHA